MNNFFSIVTVFLVLISGCVSTQNYRVVSENDIPNYLEQVSDLSAGSYQTYWVQPNNKEEKCEFLVWGYSFDGRPFEKINSEQVIWDGGCKDGKTHGLGKLTGNLGSFDAYEIAYHNLGITDRHYYRGVVGDETVKFGSYIQFNGEYQKRLETTAIIDSDSNIELYYSFLEVDNKNGVSKGIIHREYSDGTGKFTGLIGNSTGMFFGTRDFYDSNKQPTNSFLGFANLSTDKPDSYVISQNKQGIWHQFYEFGTIKEHVQLPQSYINTALKATEEAASLAQSANSSAQLALAMKKKYDSIKNNHHVSISPDPKGSRQISTGTGFFISNDGYLLTNSHVVNGASKLSIILGGKQVETSLIDQDTNNDIALLKVPRAVKGLPLELKRKTKQGADIAVLGYPNIGLQGNEQKVSFGHINANSGAKGDIRYFQISAPIQPGNSGSPMVNETGNVIGIASASLSQNAAIKTTGTIAQNVNYAVKIAYALPMLITHNVAYQEAKGDIILNKTTLAETISKSVVLVVAE